MKKLLAIILSFLCCFILVACDFNGEVVGNTTQLPTPTIKEVLNDYVYWEEVPNASSYLVKINDYEEAVGNQLKYSISSIMDSRVETGVPTELHIYVKAKGNQILYSDSEWSSEYVYTYTKKSSGGQIKKTNLPVPSNIKLTDYTLSWNAVDNAIGYNLKIDGDSTIYTTAMESYNISTLFNESTTFKVQLQSIASESSNYNNSDWTVLTTLSYVKSSQGSGTTYNVTGIGFGVNVVTALTFDDIKGDTVLDISKLQNSDYVYLNSNSSRDSKSTSSNSIREFLDNNTMTMNLGVDANGKSRTMYCNVSAGISTSSKVNYCSYKNKYFYIYDSWIPNYTLYLNNYSSSDTYSDLYSRYYLYDLENLFNSQSQANFESFFNKYGTHLIGSALFGGRLNIYYTIVSNEEKIDASISSKIEQVITAGISKVNNGKINLEEEISKNTSLKISECKVGFYASTVGGNVLNSINIDGYAEGYKSWADSLNDSKKSAIIKYSDNGLVALWDILPSEYSSMKDAMSDAFKKYYDDNYSSFIDSFDYNNIDDYAGGAGTEDNPYRISNAKHLQNIGLNPNAYFEIINPIHLDYRIWTPIKYFNGVLNGKNYTIYSMKIDYLNKDDLTSMSTGFICENSGIIQNIHFEDFELKVSHTENTNEQRRILGGVVGINKEGAIIKNVSVKKSKFKASLQFANDACSANGNLTVSLGGITGLNYGTVSYCIASENDYKASTNAMNNFCDDYSIVGGIVGSNYSELNNSISMHNNLYSYSKGGWYKLFQGSGHLRSWNGYLVGNNKGNVSKCISYNQDSGSSTVETNDLGAYIGIYKYNGLAFGINQEGGTFDNVYVTQVDNLNFLGSKSGYSEYIKDVSYIISVVSIWSEWNYDSESNNFYFEKKLFL